MSEAGSEAGLALGRFVDARAVDVEASLAWYGVRHVAVERSVTFLVAPRKRVQVRLRLHDAHAHMLCNSSLINDESRSAPHCTVLPPGKFNSY